MTIRKWIESLPTDVDALRDYLVSCGDKGIKGSNSHCPLARNASRLIGRDIWIDSAYLTDACEDFIVNFDNGCYPELIDDTT